MMLVDSAATSYVQGVGGKKSARIAMGTCYK